MTAVGVHDLTELAERYPEIEFVQADGRELVSELVRVAKNGFVTTPNRWFPVEPHTHVPLFHWLPRRPALLLLRREWTVWLLSRRTFRRLFPAGVDVDLRVRRMGGWPATLVAIFRRH